MAKEAGTSIIQSGIRGILALLVGMAILQIAICTQINRFMFHPVKEGYSESSQGYVDIGTNGVRIAAIVSGPRHGKAAIIFFHGNAEDATSAKYRFAGLAKDGYTVCAVDYPGYGLSDGSPNETGCYRVAHRLYDWLVEERGFSPKEIFAVGFSIGTGVAVELASSRHVAGLWLEAPYLSAPRIVTRKRILAIDPFPSYSRIADVECPLVVMHGTNDKIIPFSQGKALYDLAKDPKTFVPVPFAGHNDLVETYGFGKYEDLMREFLSKWGNQADSSGHD